MVSTTSFRRVRIAPGNPSALFSCWASARTARALDLGVRTFTGRQRRGEGSEHRSASRPAISPRAHYSAGRDGARRRVGARVHDSCGDAAESRKYMNGSKNTVGGG